MASTQRIARKLGWLLACLMITGLGCDDDKAADSGADHDDDHAAAGGGAEDEHDTSHMVGPLTGTKCPDPNASTLTYANFGQKFFSDYCLGCHSTAKKGADRHDAPADHNFDTLDDITLLAPHIDQLAGIGPAAQNRKMPPVDPKPTDDERMKLSEWLACGAKEQ